MKTTRKPNKARPLKGIETRRRRAGPFAFRLKVVPFHPHEGVFSDTAKAPCEIRTHSVNRRVAARRQPLGRRKGLKLNKGGRSSAATLKKGPTAGHIIHKLNPALDPRWI